MPDSSGRAWAFATTWTSASLATIAAFLLIGLAYAGPTYSITETDFSGMSVFVTRLAGATFMAVLLLSCLLQALIYLPQHASKRPGPSAPAVLDLLLITGIVGEVMMVLSVGFDDRPHLNGLIIGCGLLIALVSIVRFVVVVTSAARQAAARRHGNRPS